MRVMKSAYTILYRNHEGRILLGKLGLDERSILKWILKIYVMFQCVDWIHLAQNMVKLRYVVNMRIKLRAP
jgi:hypothetical protein